MSLDENHIILGTGLTVLFYVIFPFNFDQLDSGPAVHRICELTLQLNTWLLQQQIINTLSLVHAWCFIVLLFEIFPFNFDQAEDSALQINELTLDVQTWVSLVFNKKSLA